jgi:hypothetical protein
MNLSSHHRSSRSTGQTTLRRARLGLESLEERALPSGFSAIQSNFNGTPIHAGDTLWFNSVVKVSGLGATKTTLNFVNSTIDFTANGTSFDLKVPSAAITFDPAATSATTTFDPGTNTWDTIVPMNPGGNVYLSGLALPLPGGLPGGINPVTWSGTFQSATAGLSVNWQWATAVYTNFSTDYTTLGVKPVDNNHLSVYQNSDHAGTPENFRVFVTGGARGGGGSNFTGSYSGTGHAVPDIVQPPIGCIEGVVLDEATGTGQVGVVVTLSWSDASGQHSLSTLTGGGGAFSFEGLEDATYTLTETPPIGYQDDTGANLVGSLGGSTTTNQFNGIVLSGGACGTNYVFENVTSAPS